MPDHLDTMSALRLAFEAERVVIAAVSPKINGHGGVGALASPAGASSSRVLTTQHNALQFHHRRVCCAAICIGDGEAAAMVVERLA